MIVVPGRHYYPTRLDTTTEFQCDREDKLRMYSSSGNLLHPNRMKRTGSLNQSGFGACFKRLFTAGHAGNNNLSCRFPILVRGINIIGSHVVVSPMDVKGL
jgi:hypothetical protein